MFNAGCRMPDQRERITIVDIARECGCSKTTVACAVDARTAHKVAQKTREKIYEAVRRLGYLPNRSAKALRLQKTYTVGVMLPEPANSFYGNIVLNLQRQLADRGYTALFAFWENYDDVETIQRALDMLLSRGVDGIITGQLSGIHLEKCNVPVIRWQEPGDYDSFSSFPDMECAYERLLAILREKNCRNYAIMTNALDQGRAAILIKLFARHRIPLRKDFLMDGIRSPYQASEAMRKLLRNKTLPDVLIANNDYLALAAMAQAVKNGIRVPEQMKFVGFDGIPESGYLHPSLTTFFVPPEAIAEKLIFLLFRRLENPNADFMSLSLMPELLIRDSI